MNKTAWFFLALTFIACAFTVPKKELSQNGPEGVVVRVEGKLLPRSDVAAQRITEAIKSTVREKNKTRDGTRARSFEQVRDLVKQFKLNEPTPPNEKLAFGNNEIEYWSGRKLGESD